VATIENWKTH